VGAPGRASAAERAARLREAFRDDPPPDPPAAPLCLEEPRICEHARVVADRGLAPPERRLEVAGAELASLGDERHEAKADRVRQGGEELGECPGFVLPERRCEE
jgi:hypothetical protein